MWAVKSKINKCSLNEYSKIQTEDMSYKHTQNEEFAFFFISYQKVYRLTNIWLKDFIILLCKLNC